MNEDTTLLAVDCYWQVSSVRIRAPEATYLCRTPEDAQDCVRTMMEAGARQVTIQPYGFSVGQSPTEWNNE